ncbi:hypothetical protein C7974DRAFT_201882 [Boeremia exigua]|uniref:uncharacterized protein n=1 Tax=Boeremia exigua TaxID=749465 RepID=UPI001E8D0836|nr:uncharacterized protein C7974DRAFT_201882 [Boeremia exigua]KAH6625451.1 hypothetical protein C7974DRAFT_201882 [Boeremia exigua]
MIWRFAFGDRDVSVTATAPRGAADRSPSVQYSIYPDRETKERNGAQLDGPSLVSRQFWSEASHVFASTSIFDIEDPASFRLFALSNRDLVRRIRRIRVWCYITVPSHLCSISRWAAVLTSSIVGRLERLKGLEFEVVLDVAHTPLFTRTDVMTDPRWKALKMPVILRSLQQHQLQRNRTNVTVIHRRHGTAFVDTDPLRRVISSLLMEYHPRRISKRGSAS